MNKLLVFSIALLGIVLVGCASSPSIDAAAQPDSENLLMVSNGPFDETKITKGLDLSKYKNIIVKPITMEYKPSHDDYKISEKSLNEVSEKFSELLIKSISEQSGLQLVETTQADTVELSVNVVDLVVNVPKDIDRKTNAKIFSKQPITMAIEGTLVAIESGNILVRFKDKEMPESITFEELNRITVGAEVRQLIRRWASVIGQGLNDVSEY